MRRGAGLRQSTVVTRALDRRGYEPPFPPEPWFGWGPRGGVYVATGARTTRREYRDDIDHVAITDVSEGSRYVPPGTRLHRAALEQLGRRP